MKHAIDAGKLAIAIGLLSASTGHALAEDRAMAEDGALAARVVELEAAITELKAMLDAERAESATHAVRLEDLTERVNTPVVVAPEPGVESTAFTFGGFVDLDSHVTQFSDGGVGFAETSWARPALGD